jgi:hypothetical protein
MSSRRSHHSSAECELLQLSGYLTPGFLTLNSATLQSTPLHITISARLESFLFFSLSFLFVPIHFSKKKNWRKVFFWMLPIPIKISFWTVVLWNIMQFPMDISVMDTGKYMKLVFTGHIRTPRPGSPGPELIYVVGLEIVYLLMYFWTRTTRSRFRTKRYKGTPLAVLRPYHYSWRLKRLPFLFGNFFVW